MSAHLIRCRACGYVMSASSSREVCPACGVPRTSFEEFTDRVSRTRRAWLELHVHQISVHIPQAFSMLFLPALLLGWWWPGQPGFDATLLAAAEAAGVVFPLAVALSAVTGLVDGRTRYRALTAPFLRVKLVAALVLFASSVGISGLMLTLGLNGGTVIPAAAFGLVAMGCSAVLGRLGGKLACPAMGGK